MVHVYNSNVEDYTSHKNNIPIYRGTIFGNPFTYNGKKSKLATKSFKTRDEALDAYRLYFKLMYEQDAEFKLAFDTIYEKYKNGEDLYLQCFCKPLKCHGDILVEELQKKLILEKRQELLKK